MSKVVKLSLISDKIKKTQFIIPPCWHNKSELDIGPKIINQFVYENIARVIKSHYLKRQKFGGQL